MATMQRGQAATLITDQRVDQAKKKLEQMKGEMIKVAGPLVDPDELVRFTLNAGIKNKKLFECFDTLPGTASVFLSIITSRILGIPCDGIHAFLVPFNDRKQEAVICQLIVGYKGFVQLALANPNVASFNAQPVFDDDKFDYEYGTESFLRHRPSDKEHKDSQLTHSYAEYKSTKGGKDFRVLTRSQIEKRREVSKSKDDGPWKLWYPEMATKTAILSLAKVAPLGHKVQMAARVTERIEAIGTLTANDVTDLRSATDTRGITQEDRPHESFETQREECETAIKDAKKPPKKDLMPDDFDWDEKLSKDIETAKTGERLDAIQQEVDRLWGDGKCDGAGLAALIAGRRGEVK